MTEHIELPPPPPVVECETCHLPVPISDSLCPHCGSVYTEAMYDALR